MSMTMVYAISAPITAFVTCAFLSFMMKNFKMGYKLRMIIVYLAFLRLCFVMESGGSSVFNIDTEFFNFQRFIFRAVAGIFVCIGMYLWYIRDELSDKYGDKLDKKSKK